MTEKTQQKEQISNWKLYLEILAKQVCIRKSLYWLLPLLLVYVAMVVTEPYFYKLFVDTLQTTLGKPELFEQTSLYFIQISVLWIVLVFLSIGTFTLYDFSLNTLANKGWKEFSLETSKKMLRLPMDYHISTNPGEKQKVYDRGVDTVWNVAYETYVSILPQILIFVSLLAFGFFINPLMMLASLAILPVGVLVSITIGKRAHTLQKTVNNLWDKIFGRFGDGLTNLGIIRLYAREKQENILVGGLIDTASREQFQIRKLWCFLNAGGKILEFVGKVGVTIVGVFLILHGRMTIGDLFFFVAIASRIYAPLQSLETSYRNIVRYVADFSKVRTILHMADEPDTGTKILKGLHNTLTYNHLSFSYPSNDREVLRDISFEIRKGQKVAFVGHTGSGKTTLTQLLTRFYDPISGSIEIDGTDIRDFTLESYRSKLAAVFQDTTLFNDTIRHNLEYVRDGVTFEQIQDACRKANILEFIEGLEKGFDTEVGERGLKLSGGEKQRLAIARAIIADPEILILDEATSALDAKTERLIQDSFNTLMEGRTSIIIAHRLSTIRHADRIFLFEKGELIGQGSHDELYVSSPVYREMVDYQKNGFVEEEEIAS
ncbi:MAG: ABC transporter ATP-binding protein [Candidatus Gracilibacteria bacterium]|nr:ABC transporter ATP-binding protein [Candidatus Gracilibacteria bacterium]